METCQVCHKPTEHICIVSVLVPGRDEQGIHNTAEIGRLCSDCVVKLIYGEITLPTPDNALGLETIG